MKSISDKDFSTKMVLKLSWGSSWSIKISSNSSFYYMEKSGWDQFLRNNGLGNNEFLTFTHKGNMCFTVDIYQVDTMEMIKPRKSATFASSSSCKFFHLYDCFCLMLMDKQKKTQSLLVVGFG